MKRTFAILMMTAVLAVTLIAAAGCGGQESQAKEYLATADDLYAGYQENAAKLESILTPMLGGAMGGNYAAITVQGITDAQAQIQDMLEVLPEISAKYQDVDDLSGVEDYQAYADAMVQTIEADTEALKGTKSLLDSLMPVVQSGDQAQIAAWFQANSATIVKTQELQVATETAYADAQQIKKDKNLSFE